MVSSCIAPDSVVKMYKDDADRLTLKRINTLQSSFKDSVNIPKTWSDTVLNALIAVYNATTLPARNTIVGLNIHTFPSPTLTNINVSADSNLFWMHQLRNNIIPTGFSSLDSLLSMYDFHVDYYHDWGHFMPYHTVSFRSDSNYNVLPLTIKFDSISGVMYTEVPSVGGDGNNITDSILPNYVKLIYSYGWQDCESGCIYRHAWEFKVHYNCSVEFTGEYGSPYSTTNVSTAAGHETIIYPNPTSNHFFIETRLSEKQNVSLYDVNGKNVFSKIISGSESFDASDFENGVYLMTIKNSSGTTYKKLVIAR